MNLIIQGILLKPWKFFKAWVVILIKQGCEFQNNAENDTVAINIDENLGVKDNETVFAYHKDKTESDSPDKLMKSWPAHIFSVCFLWDEIKSHDSP